MKKRHTPEQIVRLLREADAELAAGASRSPRSQEGSASARRPSTAGATTMWRDEGRCDQAPEGTGEGERPPEEDRRRAGRGHRHPKGGESGKLLSPSRRRAAVEHVRRRLGVSERRACRVLEQPRSSQRYVCRKAGKDVAVVQRMVALSRQNPR